MTTISFDTLAFTEELTAAGIPEAQAKAQTRAISKVLESRKLATQADIGILQKELIAMEERLRRESAEQESRIIKWIVATAGIVIAAIKFIPAS